MRFQLNVREDSLVADYEYTADVLQEKRSFPILTIGRGSYIEQAIVENVLDSNLIYNLHIGRYSCIASDVTFIIDLNHDYKRVSLGRIPGVLYQRPSLTRRKGQIIIMNDCWIGEHVTILSGVTIGNGAVVAAGAVVTKDIPPYAIAAGNPAEVIGFRFEQAQIEALNLIRWWNWPEEEICREADSLYGNVDTFIDRYLSRAKDNLSSIIPISITPIEKKGFGKEQTYLYIPDFEQDYPTYPQVIRGFAQSFADTNTELLLYIKEDESLSKKLELLDAVFAEYEDTNCYINMYIGNVEDERSLFSQADAYITNRSLDNVKHIDMAQLFGLSVISGVDIPIFMERNISSLIKFNEGKASAGPSDAFMSSALSELAGAVRATDEYQKVLQTNIEHLANVLKQISQNQYAMNQAIHNIKYEIFADTEMPIYPIIESGEKAIDLILQEKRSICRFGDGEFAVIKGENRQKFQRADKRLAKRLVEVLHSEKENILICVNDIYGSLEKYNDDCQYNIRAYLTEEVRREHYALLDMQRTYYDTYLTRPYASYIDNNTDAPKQRFQHLKQIWNNQSLLIIEGEKTRMGIGNDLFDNASDIQRILCPAEHAFDRYDEILAKAMEQDKNRLVLIALGATATVLAYDLANAGYWALDIGHIDIEYEWMLAGRGTKVPVHCKYNNEVAGGDIVEDIQDTLYDAQIIARIC